MCPMSCRSRSAGFAFYTQAQPHTSWITSHLSIHYSNVNGIDDRGLQSGSGSKASVRQVGDERNCARSPIAGYLWEKEETAGQIDRALIRLQFWVVGKS